MHKRLKNYLKNLRRPGSQERGMALILVTMVLVLLTLLVTSALYTMISETVSSRDYRNANQAYYTAEAGIQRTIDWFSHVYAPVGLSGLQDNLYPVKLSNQFVTFNTEGGSTYPDSAQVTSFTNFLSASNNVLLPIAGNLTFRYNVTARLLTSRSAVIFLSGQSRIERWRIESTGIVMSGSVSLASSQVATIIETVSQPIVNHAICADEFTFSGSAQTDSFDSSTGALTLSNSGASVGTYQGSTGPFSMSGSSVVHGALDIGTANPSICPRADNGCGTNYCGNLPAIAAFCPSASSGALATQYGSTYYALPNICSAGGCPGPPSTADGGNLSFVNGYLRPQAGASGTVCFFFNKFTISGGDAFTFDNITGRAGSGQMNVYIDQFTLSGGSQLVINSNANNPIYLYVKSKYASSGGSVTNSPLNAGGFFIIYTGSADSAYSGASGSGTVFISTDPGSKLALSGGSELYGMIYSKGAVTLSGGTNSTTGRPTSVHFDQALKNSLVTVFNFIPNTEVRRIR